jgi:cardiolipin synthase (CMP-forming)
LPQNIKEDVFNIPNILTFSRILATPVIGYCIVNNHPWTALGLVAYAGATDGIDGWLARKWNMQTVVGSVIDPMADKILMTVLTVALTMQGTMPRKSSIRI